MPQNSSGSRRVFSVLSSSERAIRKPPSAGQRRVGSSSPGPEPSDRVFASPIGRFSLERRPVNKWGEHDGLLAWDAADELLLGALAEALDNCRLAQPRLLIISDSFGALTVATVAELELRGLTLVPVTVWTDSAVAELAIDENLTRNHLSQQAREFVSSTAVPAGGFDIVLWRLPASRAQLDLEMEALAGPLRGATVIAGGMDRYLPPRVQDTLAALGTAAIRRGSKKAHVLDVRVETHLEASSETQPQEVFSVTDRVELVRAPSVFGGEFLDAGTRVFLDAFDLHRMQAVPPNGPTRIADLGCGSGVLGIVAAQAFPSAVVTFFDESYRSVQAAQVNAAHNLLRRVEFEVDDGMHRYRGPSFDLVLCNPPFHQRGAVTDRTARELFRQARHQLDVGGELWVVGNRHLGYHQVLSRLFGNVEQLAKDTKFVVLRSQKR